MSNISVFQFHSQQIRIVLINNEPWFIAKDVCNILEHSNSRMALERLKDYEKGVTTVYTRGGNQDMAIISESGLYRLVLTSRKPQAEPFQDWVCQEVLPQIRKTGKYEPQQKTSIYVKRIEIATKWDIPKGHWCVFHEISLLAHKVGVEYPVAEYDLIDGSVGICWNKYRKAQEWAQDTTTFVVTFGDKRDEARVKAKAYKNSELVYFRDWLENIYTYDRLPKYLTEKYGTLRKVN